MTSAAAAWYPYGMRPQSCTDTAVNAWRAVNGLPLTDALPFAHAPACRACLCMTMMAGRDRNGVKEYLTQVYDHALATRLVEDAQGYQLETAAKENGATRPATLQPADA